MKLRKTGFGKSLLAFSILLGGMAGLLGGDLVELVGHLGRDAVAGVGVNHGAALQQQADAYASVKKSEVVEIIAGLFVSDNVTIGSEVQAKIAAWAPEIMRTGDAGAGASEDAGSADVAGAPNAGTGEDLAEADRDAEGDAHDSPALAEGHDLADAA